MPRIRRTRKGDLCVASIPRRLLASLIDLVFVLAGGGLAIGAYTGTIALLGKKEALDLRRLPEITQSKQVRIVLSVFTFVASVLLTGRRGPGFRIVGIRLVDARTGGPVSLRQATVRVSAQRVWPPLVRRFTSRPLKAQQARQQEMRSRIEALKREYGEDREALQLAITEAYRETQIRPYTACLPALIPLLFSLAIQAPALCSPLRQGLPDKLAGTTVVRDDG